MSEIVKEERLKRFQNMGIPTPLPPPDASMMKGPVKNAEFASKLEAIKKGAIKKTVDLFLERETGNNGFKPMEVSKPKNGQNPNVKPVNNNNAAPALFSAPVQGGMFNEEELYGKSTEVPFTQTASEIAGRGYRSNLNENVDDNGSDFLSNIKMKLAEKVQRNPATTLLKENKGNNINSNDLTEAITLVSTDVCKKLFKQFASELLNSQSGLIKESEKVKKVEIVKEDIIKMGDKFFKITPVVVKKKI